MAESIKTITDRAQFKPLFDRFFNNRLAFIKTKSGDLKIQYLGFSDESVAFRIPRVKNVPDSIIIFTRFETSTIYAGLKLLENSEDTFVFLPKKMQIIDEGRRENRTSIGGEGKSILYVSNLISDTIIQSYLTENEKKVDNIKERILPDLKKKYDIANIVLAHEAKIDPRMKHFAEIPRPIFIPDMNAKPEEKDLKDFNLYLNEIYSRDYKLSGNKEIISEISVPVIFRTIIPYGYIRINSTRALTDADSSIIRRLAVMLNDVFVKQRLFVPGSDKFLVYDISRNGIGIVFKDRRQTRFFKQGSIVSLDMVLPNQNKVIMGIIIRNTSFIDNGVIKVGAQIMHVDALSEVNFDEYLASIHQDG